MKNPDKFILNSNIKYHKMIAKGSLNTTDKANQTVTLYDGVPDGGTWLIGVYYEGSGNPGTMRSGAWGYVDPTGKLKMSIQRQAPVTKEIIYWRVYAD